MNSINNVVISGIVGRLNSSNTTKGTCMVSFLLETEKENMYGTFKSQIPVKIWGKTAEEAKLDLQEGCHVVITGSIDSSSYEKDGKKTYKTEVTARQFFISGGYAPQQDIQQYYDTPADTAQDNEPYAPSGQSFSDMLKQDYEQMKTDAPF